MTRARIIRHAVVIGGVLAVVAGSAAYKQYRSAGVEPASPANGMPTLINFGAGKCAACKEMEPILAELRREYAGRAAIQYADVLRRPEDGRQFGIYVIPTQVFFDRDRKEVWRHEGFLSKAEIVARLKELGPGDARTTLR
ncbi:MAG TPA: thioredoxin family protein [Phycisphaerae bacterium]|nr:thioredoxin family protein [Phycisphaerae bacterium]